MGLFDKIFKKEEEMVTIFTIEEGEQTITKELFDMWKEIWDKDYAYALELYHMSFVEKIGAVRYSSCQGAISFLESVPFSCYPEAQKHYDLAKERLEKIKDDKGNVSSYL